jgi:tetratricopeptide (TPR) repeat protein
VKQKAAALAIVCLVVASIGFAQTSTYNEAQTEHYRILSEVSQEHAELVGTKMEAMLQLFNDYFHFDLEGISTPLKVRIFASKVRFDNYLRRIIDESRDDYVYLHYTDLAKSELVGYDSDLGLSDPSMNHQSFIQYLRAFVPNPPLWMREGFAVFFEKVEFDTEFKQLSYHENLAWLESLKSIVVEGEGTPLPMDELLAITVDSAREKLETFYPQAWGVVSFLVNSENRDYNRILWDSISALDPAADLQTNVKSTVEEAFQWVEADVATEAFVSYVDERKSFRGLVESGIELYAQGNLEEAHDEFTKALNLREDHHIPNYYLGLINYDNNNYSTADFYYKKALELGATEALTYYALGVNAYADNRFEEAQDFLQQTIALDPSYNEKAETLLSRMNS